jgi:hypothetical protein
MRRFAFLLVALLLLPALLSGCFNLRQKLTLNKDLSGSLTIGVGFGLDTIVGATAMAEQQENPEAPPRSDEEIKASVLANVDQGLAPDGSSLSDGDRTMPEGLTLLGNKLSRQGEELEFTVEIGFDHVDRLDAIRGQEGMAQDAGQFLGALLVTPKGRKVTLAGSPLALGELTSGEDQESMQMAMMMMGDSKFSFELVTPLKVKKSNGSKTESGSQRWDWSIQEVLDAQKSGVDVVLAGAKPPKKR